ncbi:hypothetical protein ANN_17086 [Periplaneta americana]|uniref:Uncharacterized protein n=1 Tax=Periplaneta americana TaxID=6978 RepID=A0ABQ8ST02_PERAM|nr:hypothetical protein ANN_17086 [Periplaneta americana]
MNCFETCTEGMCKDYVRSFDRSQWIEDILQLAMEHFITEGMNCFSASQAYGIPTIFFALYNSGRQHSLKWVKGKRSRPVCPVDQQEEVESIFASSYECTIVQCVLRGSLANMARKDSRGEELVTRKIMSDEEFCQNTVRQRKPNRKTFVRLHYRLCEYGKFNSPGLGMGRPRSTTPEVQEEILDAVNMTPSISTRRSNPHPAPKIRPINIAQIFNQKTGFALVNAVSFYCNRFMDEMENRSMNGTPLNETSVDKNTYGRNVYGRDYLLDEIPAWTKCSMCLIHVWAKCSWFRERHCDDTPLAGQRQIQMERSFTPVSDRVGAVGGYDGWINFENETQDRQEWRNAICEREGKDSGFSYDLLDGARTTFRGMVLRDQPGEYCRRNGRTYYEHVVVSAPKYA